MTNKIESEFVTYEQAVALKELEFDEPCFGFYSTSYYGDDIILIQQDVKGANHLVFKDVLAPLKQQVFRWFREKYKWYANLSSWIHEEEIGIYHEFEIYGTPNSAHGSIPFKTYEEAENACIDKLIEIAKESKK
jgi:hypothetical protein